MERSLMTFAVALQCLVIVKIFLCTPGRHRLIQRRHCDINVSFENQLRHEPVKQRQKQRGNVRAVHIGIRHDDDLVITQLRDIEIVAVAF